jgi:hypothetical protein
LQTAVATCKRCSPDACWAPDGGGRGADAALRPSEVQGFHDAVVGVQRHDDCVALSIAAANDVDIRILDDLVQHGLERIARMRIGHDAHAVYLFMKLIKSIKAGGFRGRSSDLSV